MPREQQPLRPWRTEGLPPGDPARQRRRWITTATWIVGYGVLFAMFTLQDRLGGPQAVPYTECKGQVAAKNVTEVFANGTRSRRAEEGRSPAGSIGSHVPAVHNGATNVCEQ